MKQLLLLFKALSDETRLRIIKLLESGELCVCDIAEALSTPQPNISFHIGLLKDAGIIKDRKDGRWVYYSLDLSDIFVQLLVLGASERAVDSLTGDDKERLKTLLSNKGVSNLCSQ